MASGSAAQAQFAAPPGPTAPSQAAQPAAAGAPPAMQPAAPPNAVRDRSAALAAEAKLAVARGDLAAARGLIDQANSLHVPESAYEPNQLRPWQVAMELARAEARRGGVATAAAVQPAGGPTPVQTGVFQPGQDPTAVQPASAMQLAGPAGTVDDLATGEELYRRGVEALTAQDRARAIELFSAAWKKQGEMDPLVRAQLKDKLSLLTAGRPEAMAPQPLPTAVEAAAQEQALLRQKLFREVTTEIADAERMVNDDPLAALGRLQSLRQRVSQSNVEGGARKEYLAMVDRVINNVDAYIKQNQAAIGQQQKNTQIEQDRITDAAREARIDAEVQNLVDEYNELVAAQRFADAEVAAKRVNELKPGTDLGVVMLTKASIARRQHDLDVARAAKNNGVLDQMHSIERSAIPFNDEDPLVMPTDWIELSRRRQSTDELQILPAERVIREKLLEPVSVSFQARPLGSAMDTVSQMTGIPIVIDPQGLMAEGLTMDQPVSLELNGNQISLKSALTHLLEPLNLTYVVKDEVLKITSRNTIVRPRERKTYHVADLVIPIPNFAAGVNSNFATALQSAYQSQAGTMLVNAENRTPTQMALAGANPAAANPAALGQMMPQGLGGGGFGNSMPGMAPGGFGSPGFGGGGAGGAGGGTMADFSTLIQLISTTIPGDWDTGEDSITEFPGNLSLIINAPLETHEQIAALLKQLRALQNLQVTVEIRFISLSEQFGEKFGVDFDFNIDDNNESRPGLPLEEDSGRSTSFGLSSGVGGFGPITSATSDLDIQFRQNSNQFAPVPFATFDPAAGAQLGFAILSDLELFFFLQAAQSDSRTNVMQAPKVTMFDGQFASVNDFAQVPFVVGLTPIVGDFAVAQAPVIVLLNDGTQLSVQSVVSDDKRFVRMTLSPAFTNVTDRNRTFTFTGSRRTNTGTSTTDDDGNPLPTNDNAQDEFVGSTVQLPTLGVTSINTTVSVPDGGTVLLGGIKRLSEGRNEAGVPILSKIPYLNRLFSNVGIGREARTFMMTVTPRIIIPEEEERNILGGSVLP